MVSMPALVLALVLPPSRGHADGDRMLDPAPPNRAFGPPLASGRSARPRNEASLYGSAGYGRGTQGPYAIVAQDQALTVGGRIVSGSVQAGADFTALSRSSLRVRGIGADAATSTGHLRLELMWAAASPELGGGRLWISPAFVATLPTSGEKQLVVGRPIAVLDARGLDAWSVAPAVRMSFHRGWLSLHTEQLLALVLADDERTQELRRGGWLSTWAVGVRPRGLFGAFAELDALVEIDAPEPVGSSVSATVGGALYPVDQLRLELAVQLPVSQEARRAFDVTGLLRLACEI